MASYYRISPKFWPDARAHGWDDRERLLALYVLTNKHRSLEGLYELPKAYIADDLGWSPAVVDRLLKRLIADGFIEYDGGARVVFVVRAIAYQAPSTEKQIQGAMNALALLPPTTLVDRLRIESESHCPELANRIRMAFGVPANANGNGSASHSNIARTPNARTPNSASSSASSSTGGEQK